jgi:hypothetical protein
MKNIFFTALTALMVVTVFASLPTAASATALSDLTAATAHNEIDNGVNWQKWDWNSLGTTYGLGLQLNTSTTVTTANSSNTLLEVDSSGASTNSGVLSIGINVSNTHSGTGSTNFGVDASVSGGSTHNYGISGQSGGTNAGDAGVWGHEFGGSGATYGVYGDNDSSSGYAGYFNNTGGGYAAAFMGGNVGIGTASPAKTLQVRAAADETLQVTGPASASSGTSIRSIKDDYSVWEPIEIVGSITILGEAGNVGVATTSPSYTLQVNGSVAGTSAYVNTSDIRHKKNIQPLEVGLKEVAQLRPVTFEWKGDTLTNHSIDGKAILRPLDPAMQGKQMGFVAQDVEKILPSIIVTEANAEKTKGMKYSELIPVLVKAIQELQSDNDNLRTQLTKDEATIASMKAKLRM